MTHPYTRTHALKPNAGTRLAHELAAGQFAWRHRARFPVWLVRMLAFGTEPRAVKYDLMKAWVLSEAPELMRGSG